MRNVVWFSCGAASAVAAKLAVAQYGNTVQVVYCDTLATEHPDNRRFMADVAAWIGVPITIIKSEKYATIDEVFHKTRYMSGIAGARCTVEMKKLPRVTYQNPTDTHIFGYTYDEQKRAATFEQNNQDLTVEWILINQQVTKAECLRRLQEANIPLPTMYGLGFGHNNCLGCVKATSPGYWNRTKRNFPEVFERRAKQSRLLGVRLTRVKGKRIYLDELPYGIDEPDDDIECGPACQTPDGPPR